jgi:hypothetical protein
MFSLLDFPTDVTDPDQKDLMAVRRVNDRWIVRGLLREHAADYIDHLEKNDPDRLKQTCNLVMGLLRHHRQEVQDPKALFYSGLFSLATFDEIDQFLADHCLTAAVSSILKGNYDPMITLPNSARPLADMLARKIAEYMKNEM